MNTALSLYPRPRPFVDRDPADGDDVRILVGLHRGKRGEVVDITGGVYTVRFAGGSVTYRARDLEVVR
ncbi:MAG TPA: hypothetical protein DDW98_08920 [Gammaproteobacteria bacterium]|jgi:transcription elongation factor|nr:hypothetical protein [Gammaproteobacteria bacterium]